MPRGRPITSTEPRTVARRQQRQTTRAAIEQEREFEESSFSFTVDESGEPLNRTNYRLPAQAKVLVCGPTKSGKTTTVTHLLLNPEQFLETVPTRIIIVRKAHQFAYDVIARKYATNFLSSPSEIDVAKLKVGVVVLIDDVAAEFSNNRRYFDFLSSINHFDCVIFVLSPFIYNVGKFSCPQRRLYTQFILFRSPYRENSTFLHSLELPNLVYDLAKLRIVQKTKHAFLLLDLAQIPTASFLGLLKKLQ